MGRQQTVNLCVSICGFETHRSSHIVYLCCNGSIQVSKTLRYRFKSYEVCQKYFIEKIMKKKDISEHFKRELSEIKKERSKMKAEKAK